MTWNWERKRAGKKLNGTDPREISHRREMWWSRRIIIKECKKENIRKRKKWSENLFLELYNWVSSVYILEKSRKKYLEEKISVLGERYRHFI